MADQILITTDKQGRVTLPGHRNERFLVEEYEDGTMVLRPAIVVNAAQAAYDRDPAFQAMISGALAGKTVTQDRRSRRRRSA